MGPFTGDVAQYGLLCEVLCTKEFNKKGGVTRQDWSFIVEDEKGDSTRGHSCL